MQKEIKMSKSNVITGDQLKLYMDSDSEMSDEQRQEIAKRLSVRLPEAPPAELPVQLQEVKVVRNYVGKRGKNPQPRDYVTVPSLKLDGDGAKGFWVRTSVARAVAERILAVCDAEGIE
jgi:hypothetical protein